MHHASTVRQTTSLLFKYICMQNEFVSIFFFSVVVLLSFNCFLLLKPTAKIYGWFIHFLIFTSGKTPNKRMLFEIDPSKFVYLLENRNWQIDWTNHIKPFKHENRTSQCHKQKRKKWYIFLFLDKIIKFIIHSITYIHPNIWNHQQNFLLVRANHYYLKLSYLLENINI